MSQDRGSNAVAITGGAGYMGSALVPRLIALGYRVRVIPSGSGRTSISAGHKGLTPCDGRLSTYWAVLFKI